MRVLEAALAGAQGGVLVVEGPAGAGKTAFLQALRERTATSSAWILSATGGELEGDFAFGVVRQLFDPITRGRGDALEGPARHAAAALGLVEEEHPAEATTQEALHGLYWLAAELADERPLLLAIDDAHWADAPSIEFVEYLARRTEDLPLGVVIATRPDQPGSDLGPIRRVARLPHATLLPLRDLSPAAVTRLVRERLGRDADEGFCRACHEATGGNPFLVLELLKELADEGVPPTAKHTPRIANASPEAVLRTILVRLAALPEPAGRLAEALAVLGGEAPLRHAGALAELDPTAAAEGEEALIRADIARPAGDAIVFAHSLVREVIYSDLSPARRTLAHARAAEVMHEATASAEEIVPHLLASDPTGEPWRLDVLREAARVALERGVPAIAVSALRRVIEESPAAADDPAVLEQLGSAEMAMLDPQAVEHLREAIERTEDPNHRGTLARTLARAYVDILGDMPGTIPVLEQVLEARDELRPAVAMRLEADYLSVARRLPHMWERAHARLDELRNSEIPDDPAAAPLLANLALHALESTEPADVVAAYAGRALADPASFFVESGWIFSYAANTLTWIDRGDAARAAWTAALEEGRQRGSLQLHGFALSWRVHLLTRIGEMAEAEADFRAGLALIGDELPPYYLAYGAALFADILLERGGLEEAEPLLAAADPDITSLLHSSRSRVAYSRGQFEEARDAALACGEMLAWTGGRDAPSIIPWRSEAALAMAALGDTDEALRLATEELELARKQEVPRAIGVTLRALGVIEDPGIDRIEEAVEILEGSGSRIELARALVDLGATIRRTGRRKDAREPLRRGMDLARHLGATVLEERALEELLATGARPRRKAVTGVESLTPTELRVARLAAQGKTNREIAQGLFVSMSTVATHLNHAYQKLQIAGRDELAEAL